MLKRLFAATAFAALTTSAAFAQQSPPPAQPAAPEPAAPSEPAKPVETSKGLMVSSIIGEGGYNGTADNAENVGKVTDILLDNDGKIEALIVGVGGFLGVGQKDVQMPYADAQWVEKNGDRWIAVPMTKEAMQAAPAFDPAPYLPVTPASTEPVAPNAAAPAAPAEPTTTPTEPKMDAAPATPAPANPAPTTPAAPAPAQ